MSGVPSFQSPGHDYGLGEPQVLSLRVAGVRIDIIFGSGFDELVESMRNLWAPHLVRASDVDAADRMSFVTTPDPGCPEAVVLKAGPASSYVLSGHITRAVIRRLIGQRLLLHAGVVEHPRFGVIVLVGPSGAGKSTASVELGRSGRYLTDELAILEPIRFQVTGYPKPVSRVDSALDGRGKRDISLEELGLVPGQCSAAPDHILLLERRDAGLAQANNSEDEDFLERLPLHQALLRIVEQSSSLWCLPGGLARLAELLTSTGGAIRVRYRESATLASLLEQIPEPVDEDWRELVAGSVTAVDPKALVPAEACQSLTLESGAVILGERRAIYAPGLVGLVWSDLYTSGGRTVEQLELEVVRLIGPHPDSSLMVREAVNELVRESWVQQVGQERD